MTTARLYAEFLGSFVHTPPQRAAENVVQSLCSVALKCHANPIGSPKDKEGADLISSHLLVAKYQTSAASYNMGTRYKRQHLTARKRTAELEPQSVG